MNGFFRYDGPFYRFGSMLGDVMILSVLWVMCSIPIITIGASTTALFYAMTKRVGGGDGGVAKDFFRSFRKDFLKATLAFALLAVMVAVIFWAVQAMRDMLAAQGGQMTVTHYVFQAIVYIDLLETVIVGLYIFPVLSRFDMSFGQLIKTSFFMAHRHLLTTVLCAGTFAFIALVVQWSGFLLIAAPGLYGFMASYLFLRVFRKYRPEIIKTDPSLEPLAPLNLDDGAPTNDESEQQSEEDS